MDMNLYHKIELWAQMLQKVRKFFEEKGFLEVYTPAAVPAGAFEAWVEPFNIESNPPLQLHTSPEIAMKKLIALLPRDCFQIAKVFRQDPKTNVHLSEFTMLEYYQMQVDYRVTKELTQSLIQSLSPKPLSFKTITVKEAFESTTQTPWTLDREELYEKAKKLDKIHLTSNDSWDDLFIKILVAYIEPSFDPETPTFFVDYPPSQSALAALSPDKSKAERFELYWKDMELCNGCSELPDVEVLKKRYELQCQIRTQAGLKPHPFPQVLLEAIEKGPKKFSGVAVGLERLFAALYDLKSPWDISYGNS